MGYGTDGTDGGHAAADTPPRGVVDPSRGVWTFTTDVDLLRRLAAGGFDWVALDAQHGPLDRAALHAVGRALGDAGAPFVVRVPAVDAVWIGAALDAGAAAVVVPSVTDTSDAVRAARASRYPPEGERSWGPFAPLWGGVAPDPAGGERRGALLGDGRDRRSPGRRRRDRGDSRRGRALRRTARPRPRAGAHGRRAARRPLGGQPARHRSWRRRSDTASSRRASRARRRTRDGCGRTASGASR